MRILSYSNYQAIDWNEGDCEGSKHTEMEEYESEEFVPRSQSGPSATDAEQVTVPLVDVKNFVGDIVMLYWSLWGLSATDGGERIRGGLLRPSRKEKCHQARRYCATIRNPTECILT